MFMRTCPDCHGEVHDPYKGPESRCATCQGTGVAPREETRDKQRPEKDIKFFPCGETEPHYNLANVIAYIAEARSSLDVIDLETAKYYLEREITRRDQEKQHVL